jgi:hypothetical protein
MSNKETQNKTPKAGEAFTYANTNKNCPAQRAVTRECQQPQMPLNINDEDWKFGIGLN